MIVRYSRSRNPIVWATYELWEQTTLLIPLKHNTAQIIYFLDKTPFRLVGRYQHFGEVYCPLLQI
jgi:hypothetical protein